MTTPGLNGLTLMWHGVEGDARIFQADMTTSTGTPPADWSGNQIIGTSFAAPALCNQDGVHGFAAQMGTASPSDIVFAQIDGHGFEPPQPPSFPTSARPAVAMNTGGEVRLAWRSPDGALSTSAQHGVSRWTPPAVVGRTSHSPAMAAAGRDGFLLAWKPDDGVQIMGAASAGVGQPMRARGPMRPADGAMLTGDAPALCNRGGGFLMAWKGVPTDERIFWSRSRDGLNWETPREAIPEGGGIRTIAGPAITAWKFGFVLVWRGVTGDQGLWWSTLALNNPFGRWRTPARVDPADNSSSSPTLLSSTVFSF